MRIIMDSLSLRSVETATMHLKWQPKETPQRYLRGRNVLKTSIITLVVHHLMKISPMRV
uniref:Uncharacterized protein n=1 Tax=Brassica oleracea TaxID=3712 RepID=A0A3P6EVP0_BRAOL|nr:unnamed protein product [Brassica oleracea]